MTADPLARFEAEHREALAMLDRLAAAARDLRAGRDVRSALATVHAVHSFLSSAVRRHNDDEERGLFPLLEERTLTEAFVRDHERLRALERELATAATGTTPATTVPAVADELESLLRDHILREDTALFPLARARLGATGLARVAARLAGTPTGE